MPEPSLEPMSIEGPKLSLLRDLVGELVAENAALAEAHRTGKPRGPVTGLDAVDTALGGYLAAGVHILQAAPGAGKTALSLQLAATCGFPALFVSVEMPTLELFRRLICRETKTFLGRLKSGELSEAEITAKARQTAERIPHLAILDATGDFVSSTDILTAAEALRKRAESSKLLLVLDSLQVWARSAGSEATEYDAINRAISAARSIAGRLEAPLLAVSHRNRAGQKAGGLYAGKGSGDLEYAAETVLELDRKSDLPDAAGMIEMDLTVHKNRHGDSGIAVPLRFCGRLQEFEEA